MNYSHFNIYKQIYKKSHVNNIKLYIVTFKISVSQSCESQTHGTAIPPDLPSAIQSKITNVS